MLSNTLLNNPFSVSVGLNQIEGYQPVEKFIDDSNTTWVLVKSCFDSTRDIIDPKSIQVVDQWYHVFPNLKTKLFVYVVEGIRPPRTETEQPTRVLYQWFSTTEVPSFHYKMITDKEWLKANVYAAVMVDVRVSKLNAICKLNNVPQSVDTDNTKLLKVEELNEVTQRTAK